MGRRKSGSLIHQVNQKMNALARFGESRHQAKQEYRQACERANVAWNPAKADGIFSHKTYDAYKQSTCEFAKWIKQNYPEIRNIEHIQREHAIHYLKNRQEEGKSAWSVSKDMSALNKVFNLNVSKKESGLRERRFRDAERSRCKREHDHKYNPENYRQQIIFANAFGVRRESVLGGQFQAKDVSLFRHNGKIYVSLIEKGGRYREAPCLERMQPQIDKMIPEISERGPLTKEQFQELYCTSQDYLFNKYTNKIDNHAFRHEYARNLYQELLDKRDQANEQREVRFYRGYDREILQEVSEALGHSRLSVVVEYYLR